MTCENLIKDYGKFKYYSCTFYNHAPAAIVANADAAAALPPPLLGCWFLFMTRLNKY
jgi:hypothetical protein